MTLSTPYLEMFRRVRFGLLCHHEDHPSGWGDILKLCALIKGAYRGQGGESGWTKRTVIELCEPLRPDLQCVVLEKPLGGIQ